MSGVFLIDDEIAALELRKEKLARLHELRVEVAMLESRMKNPKHIIALCELVALRRGVKTAELLSAARTQWLSESRFIVFLLARKFTTCSLADIGRIFGRDHGTVMHGLARIADLLKQDKNLREDVEAVVKAYCERMGT